MLAMLIRLIFPDDGSFLIWMKCVARVLPASARLLSLRCFALSKTLFKALSLCLSDLPLLRLIIEFQTDGYFFTTQCIRDMIASTNPTKKSKTPTDRSIVDAAVSTLTYDGMLLAQATKELDS